MSPKWPSVKAVQHSATRVVLLLNMVPVLFAQIPLPPNAQIPLPPNNQPFRPLRIVITLAFFYLNMVSKNRSIILARKYVSSPV